MNASGLDLPNQLLPYSIGYSGGCATVVTMHTPKGAQYIFQPVEDGRYAVLYHDENSVPMRAASISVQDAPSALKRIFEARTIDRILELQASRQLIACTHRNLD